MLTEGYMHQRRKAREVTLQVLYALDVQNTGLNEAIDLGKVFGSENSGSFINGILDALYVKLRKKDEDNDIDHGLAGHPEP